MGGIELNKKTVILADVIDFFYLKLKIAFTITSSKAREIQYFRVILGLESV